MDEPNQDRQDLKDIRSAPGFHYLLKHIQDESVDGFKKFIDLPVEKKTSKAAFSASAQYKVLAELLDWIDTECKMA